MLVLSTKAGREWSQALGELMTALPTPCHNKSLVTLTEKRIFRDDAVKAVGDDMRTTLFYRLPKSRIVSGRVQPLVHVWGSFCASHAFTTR